MIYKRRGIFSSSTKLGCVEGFMSFSGDRLFLCVGRRNCNNTITGADRLDYLWAKRKLKTSLGMFISYKEKITND